MERSEIAQALNNLLRERTGNTIPNSLMDEQFLGSKVNMQPRDLIYLLYTMEDYFHLKVPDEYLINKKFSTFREVVDIIYELQ